MRQKKRNAKLIAEALYAIYSEEITAEKAARKDKVFSEVVYDDIYMLYADLMGLYPQISKQLKENIETYKELKYRETLDGLPVYMSKYDNNYTILIGKLEQEQDLAKYTIEELASLLRPYSTKGWITKQA